MSDVMTHSPKPHANGEPKRTTFAERRAARLLRREQERAHEQTPRAPAAQPFYLRHPAVTAGLLVGGGVVLGAVVSRVLLPPRSAGEPLLRQLARRLAL